MAKKKYWAGFVSGKIYTQNHLPEYAGNVAIFTNKKIAKKFYQDVRPVEIKEIKK
jgi:hypothetical protein